MNYLLILFVKLITPSAWKIPTYLVYAQAYHETGSFKSSIYKENKNLFGMKINSRDYDKGERRGHALYYSKLDSIKDYFARQKQFQINYENDEQYVDDTVKSGYAEDKIYKQKWLNISKKYSYLKYLKYLLALFLVPSLVIVLGRFLKFF